MRTREELMRLLKEWQQVQYVRREIEACGHRNNKKAATLWWWLGRWRRERRGPSGAEVNAVPKLSGQREAVCLF